MSLLIYLENKRYIKITYSSEEKDNNTFKIIKLKNYDGNNTYEKMFFEGLFNDAENAYMLKLSEISGDKNLINELGKDISKLIDKNVVTLNILKINFYKTVKKKIR